MKNVGRQIVTVTDDRGPIYVSRGRLSVSVIWMDNGRAEGPILIANKSLQPVAIYKVARHIAALVNAMRGCL